MLLLENPQKHTKFIKDIFAVCRIDPIVPCITDNKEDFDDLVKTVASAGAKHIITSCMDIPYKLKDEVISGLEKIDIDIEYKYNTLYTEKIAGGINANIEYRKKLFKTMREICDKHNVTMGLCMEFEKLNGQKVRGLNQEFMTSESCEGIDIPIYKRKDDKFFPVEKCNGVCLNCNSKVCNIPELAKAGAWKLRDYKRWSNGLKQSTLF